jgi:hypothetical protein
MMSLRLLGLAAVAATALGVAPASAGCWSCGCYGGGLLQSAVFAPPPVAYGPPPCAAYQRPVYVVNQGPTYTQPVPLEAMPSPFVRHPPRPYPYGASVRHRWSDHHYRPHRRVHGRYYRAPYRDYAGPRVVHVPPRYRAHPPMHPYRDPKHPVYAPRPRHYRP